MSEISRVGPWMQLVGRYDTIANLTATRPAASYSYAMAYCDDAGPVYSDGTSWKTLAAQPAGSYQYITSGASATVSSGVTTVILNGVNTTFALTFPAPLGEGQILEVNAAAAVSVAFSGVATAPATTIKTVPSTLAAGVGVAVIQDTAHFGP